MTSNRSCAGGSKCACGLNGAPDFSEHIERDSTILTQIRDRLKPLLRENTARDDHHRAYSSIEDSLRAHWGEIEHVPHYVSRAARQAAAAARRKRLPESCETEALIAHRRSNAGTPDEQVAALELNQRELEQLHNAVQHLSERDRKILAAYQAAGSGRAGAKLAGMPASSFRNRLLRTLRNLTREAKFLRIVTC
jgi:DNA-directed RNA polymerase specialized sigma24 family protein